MDSLPSSQVTDTYNSEQTLMFAEGFLSFLLWPAHDPQPQASKDSFDQGQIESLTQEWGCCK